MEGKGKEREKLRIENAKSMKIKKGETKRDSWRKKGWMEGREECIEK